MSYAPMNDPRVPRFCGETLLTIGRVGGTSRVESKYCATVAFLLDHG